MAAGSLSDVDDSIAELRAVGRMIVDIEVVDVVEAGKDKLRP